MVATLHNLSDGKTLSSWTARLHPAGSETSPLAVITPHMALYNHTVNDPVRACAGTDMDMGNVADMFSVVSVLCISTFPDIALTHMLLTAICACSSKAMCWTVIVQCALRQSKTGKQQQQQHGFVAYWFKEQHQRKISPYLAVAYWALLAAMCKRAEAFLSHHHCTCTEAQTCAFSK